MKELNSKTRCFKLCLLLSSYCAVQSNYSDRTWETESLSLAGYARDFVGWRVKPSGPNDSVIVLNNSHGHCCHRKWTKNCRYHQDVAVSCEKVRRKRLVSRWFEPSQPLGIISGLKETSIKRYIAERTYETEIRPEEQSEKTESCRENLWNEIQLKGP